ncbi:DMT family transporter [Thalassorhabdomicrobium marinisediminis]|uniref:DMT family transporter n=1 Tax=Thalassorhabdomicrobium marinisediminis TaxID=2170577 RepID=UPI002491985B|nr:DMT family transporter [Thalassorhabdomicrobium marinisediminis]
MTAQTNIATSRSAGRGVLLMCIGIACLSVNDAIAKTLTTSYAPVQILFLRNAIALIPALLIAYFAGGWPALQSRKPMAHLLRGAVWTGAAILFFTGLRSLGLAEATTLIFAAPIFIIALSSLFLKEQVGWRRWGAACVGFIGVLVVVRPGGEVFQVVALFPVGTAVLYALMMIGARWVDPGESGWTMMLYLVGAGALISGAISPFFWTPIRPEDIWLFLGIAFFGTAGMTLITQAFRFSAASIVAQFEYTGLVWATLLGWWIWGTVPDATTVIGAAIIVSSGLFIIFREGQAK